MGNCRLPTCMFSAAVAASLHRLESYHAAERMESIAVAVSLVEACLWGQLLHWHSKPKLHMRWS